MGEYSDESVGEYIDNTRPFNIHIQYELHQPVENLLLGFDVFASDGTHIFRSYDLLADGLEQRDPGRYDSVLQLPGGLFQPGAYYFEFLAGLHRLRWLSRDTIKIRLHFDGPRHSDVDFPGVIGPHGQWIVTQENRATVHNSR